MDYLAHLMSAQLMAERRAEAARHNLAKQARGPGSRTGSDPRLAGLLRLAGLSRPASPLRQATLSRPTARSSHAEGTS